MTDRELADYVLTSKGRPELLTRVLAERLAQTVQRRDAGIDELADIARRGGVNIDWPTIILNLRRAGWTHRRIAREIGVSDSTPSQWATGGNGPSLWPALRLLHLHFDECRDRHDRRLVA
jgi:hypothetical protein